MPTDLDRHKLWGIVKASYDRLEDVAPEGHQPVVDVFLVGRSESVQLGYVATSRAADDPWVRFQSASEERPDEEKPEVRGRDEQWIYVHESFVERVEIRFRRVGRFKTGFTCEVIDEAIEEGST